MNPIYLDNNATTAVAPEVADEIQPYYRELYGNPSSMHTFGGQLHRRIEEARAKVAALIGQQTYHPAWGANKKAAEQRAAQNALYELEGKPVPHIAE